MSWEGPPAPYRIETERLVIRCYEPGDASLVKDAIDSSLDHLRPWMPWTEHEPQTLEEKTDLLKSFRSQYDLSDNFVMGIFSADESEVLGGTGLHPRLEPGGLEIGYFVRASATRQGIITESTAALTTSSPSRRTRRSTPIAGGSRARTRRTASTPTRTATRSIRRSATARA